MDQEKLNKPDNLSEETWNQHLDWMSVGGEQVKENFSRHLARVKEDANRCKALSEQHQEVLRSERRTKSLFSD